MKPGVAFFDFDDTLIRGDSLFSFVGLIVGRKSTYRALLRAVWKSLFASSSEDLKTRIKRYFLHYTLTGISAATAEKAAQKLAQQIRWKESLVKKLHEHKSQGHTIVIATGALDIYMPFLLKTHSIPYDDLLATPMEIIDNTLTGHMLDNCVRQEKAARVKKYLQDEGPFADSWGYGNRPSDLPMLELVQHRTIV